MFGPRSRLEMLLYNTHATTLMRSTLSTPQIILSILRVLFGKGLMGEDQTYPVNEYILTR